MIKFLSKLFSDKEKRDDEILSSHKSLSDLELKREHIESKYLQKDKELDDEFEREGNNWGDTDSEKEIEYEQRRGKLQEQKNEELHSLENNERYYQNKIDQKKKNNKIIPALIILGVLIYGSWFLLHERQADLLYRVTGEELLRIKEECKEIAEAKVNYYKNSNIGTHQLVGHGYSEYGGFCYAEIFQNFGEEDSKLLYNTTQDKEVFRRQWPKDNNWYEYNFDNFILGKSRIIDFRAPW